MATGVRVFVYGTLMPGRLRWPLIEADVAATAPGSTVGRLYDTGHGYPAAVFDGAEGTLHGCVLELHPARADAALVRLDEIETGYRRVVVALEDGAEAISYEWIGAVDRFARIVDGRWTSADER